MTDPQAHDGPGFFAIRTLTRGKRWPVGLAPALCPDAARSSHRVVELLRRRIAGLDPAPRRV